MGLANNFVSRAHSIAVTAKTTHADVTHVLSFRFAYVVAICYQDVALDASHSSDKLQVKSGG